MSERGTQPELRFPCVLTESTYIILHGRITQSEVSESHRPRTLRWAGQESLGPFPRTAESESGPSGGLCKPVSPPSPWGKPTRHTHESVEERKKEIVRCPRRAVPRSGPCLMETLAALGPWTGNSEHSDCPRDCLQDNCAIVSDRVIYWRLPCQTPREGLAGVKTRFSWLTGHWEIGVPI